MGDLTNQPAKILVVDDEQDVRALFELQFRKEIRDGLWQFEFAANGLEALVYFEDEAPFDLVLSDINMPAMDGLSLLQKIRETHPDILVIMVTAYGDLHNIRAAMNAGAFDFLNKPFSMRDLKITIGNALEHVYRLRTLADAQAQKDAGQKALLAALQHRDRRKDELLAGTIGKLQGPLEGMVGMGQSLLDGAAGPLGEPARESLDSLVATGRQLRRMVQAMMKKAPQQHPIEADMVPCEIAPIVERAMVLARARQPSARVNLVADLPPDLPQAMADEVQLLEILRYLIENGLRHTTTGEIRVGANPTENGVQVWVRDTGSGLPEQPSEPASMRGEAENEGMEPSPGETGMAVARQFVAAHGSELAVHARPGLGTRYSFFLTGAPMKVEKTPVQPVFPQQPGTHAAAKQSEVVIQASAVRNGPFSVLAVDDEPVNLQVLVNQLSLHGIKVEPVNSGKSALAKLAGPEDFDLVILDVMMPGMSGLEVAHEVRKTQALSDLPILMLTARDRPEDVVAGLEAGANDYLAKPFDSAELLARAKSLATLRKAVRHSLEQAVQLGAERKQREQLEYLRQFNRDLSSTLEMRQVLHRFLDHVNDFAPHDLAFFCLDIKGHFEVVAEGGNHPYEPAVRKALHQICTRWSDILKVKTEPLPIQLTDELDQFGEAAQSLTGAWVGIPLINRGKLMGTLFMLRRNASRFGDQELQLAFTFSGQAGLSIENARLFERVRQLAMTDALTGLYNRRFFFNEGAAAVERAVRFGTPLSLLLLDIDHFKGFNDEFGHAVGDLVLVKLAETIKRQCRQADIAGRYGGEEIAVLMPQTKETVAGEVAERLRRAIAELRVVTEDQQPLKITVSIGVATFREDDQSLDKLLGRADDALYQAKGSGRNCVKASA